MIGVIAQNMAPIMFASLVLFLLLGYPVAFSLAANGLFFFVIGVLLTPLSEGSINLDWPLLYAHIQKTGEFELLERRLGKGAAQERIDQGIKIPGVTLFPVETISDTKAK